MSRKSFGAPGAVTVGPYSQAVEAGGFAYLSGQTPLDPATHKLVEGGIAAQTLQCFRNLESVLAAADMTSDDVVKVNVFLTDMKNFQAMNEVYQTRFDKPFPARSTIGVKELPLGAMIEIEMIAERAHQRKP